MIKPTASRNIFNNAAASRAERSRLQTGCFIGARLQTLPSGHLLVGRKISWENKES